MDPEKVTVAKGQIGFIQFLCFAFYSQISRVFPSIQSCVDQMTSNKVFIFFSLRCHGNIGC